MCKGPMPLKHYGDRESNLCSVLQKPDGAQRLLLPGVQEAQVGQIES